MLAGIFAGAGRDLGRQQVHDRPVLVSRPYASVVPQEAGAGALFAAKAARAVKEPRHEPFEADRDLVEPAPEFVHDAVDPLALMAGIRQALRDHGTYLVQEVNVSDKVGENIRPMGKMIYSVSTLYCMTTSLAHRGAGIGAAMGENKARAITNGAQACWKSLGTGCPK